MKKLKKNLIAKNIILSVIMSMMNYSSAWAVSADMQFSGRLIDPNSCIVENKESGVFIDFGTDIVPWKIDGENYSREIELNIVCNVLATNALKIKFDGASPESGFDDNVVGLTNRDLGIALTLDDKKVSINEWVKFTYPKELVLKMTLVKNPDVKIAAGSFSGYVITYIDYQ